jgi:hypothetical protein
VWVPTCGSESDSRAEFPCRRRFVDVAVQAVLNPAGGRVMTRGVITDADVSHQKASLDVMLAALLSLTA